MFPTLLWHGIRCSFQGRSSSTPPRYNFQARPNSLPNRSTSKTAANCPVRSTNFVLLSVRFERRFGRSREGFCNAFTPCSTVLTILSWWLLGRKVSTWRGLYAMILLQGVLRGEDRCWEAIAAALVHGLVGETVASVAIL